MQSSFSSALWFWFREPTMFEISIFFPLSFWYPQTAMIRMARVMDDEQSYHPSRIGKLRNIGPVNPCLLWRTLSRWGHDVIKTNKPFRFSSTSWLRFRVFLRRVWITLVGIFVHVCKRIAKSSRLGYRCVRGLPSLLVHGIEDREGL